MSTFSPHVCSGRLSHRLAGDPITPSHGKGEKSSVDDLGTIVVKVWRTILRRRVKKNKIFTNFEGAFTEAKELDEKDLKGKNVTHSVWYVKAFTRPYIKFTSRLQSWRRRAGVSWVSWLEVRLHGRLGPPFRHFYLQILLKKYIYRPKLSELLNLRLKTV